MNSVQDKSEQRSQKTAKRQDDLRERLVVAAEAVIATGGLAALRARALAEAAGCAVGAIYQVYPDLDALVLEVNGRTLDAIGAALLATRPRKKPANQLLDLAATYLEYAAANRQLWAAVFQHRGTEGRPLTPAFAARQAALFQHVERPLGQLQPGLPAPACALLARSVFAAVHGMVALGLDGTVQPMELEALRGQVRLVVAALGGGTCSVAGAGDGNRTHVCSLGSCRSTIELHPRGRQRSAGT